MSRTTRDMGTVGGCPAVLFSRCTNQPRVPHSSRSLRRVRCELQLTFGMVAGWPSYLFQRCTNQPRVPHSSRLLRRVGCDWPSYHLFEVHESTAGAPFVAPFATGGGVNRQLTFGMVSSSTALPLIFRRPLFSNSYWSAFAECIVTKTAPAPLFRFPHQSPLHWIAIHVA